MMETPSAMPYPGEHRLRPNSSAQKARECDDRQPGDAAPAPPRTHTLLAPFCAKFSDGMVSFARAEFSGGWVGFAGAEFSGSEVSFGGAKFSDGTGFLRPR
jgi:hypothetical protein